MNRKPILTKRIRLTSSPGPPWVLMHSWLRLLGFECGMQHSQLSFVAPQLCMLARYKAIVSCLPVNKILIDFGQDTDISYKNTFGDLSHSVIL